MEPTVIIVAGLLMMTLLACSSSKTAEQAVSTPINVKIGKVHPIEDHTGVSFSGAVGSPAAPSNVSFPVSGKVIQVSPREGDCVRNMKTLTSRTGEVSLTIKDENCRRRGLRIHDERRAQRGKIMKLLVIIAAGLMMTLPACSSSKTAEQAVSTPIDVEIGKVHPIEDHEGVVLSGAVGSPSAPSNVSFLVSGKVIQVSPREGDYVRKGQLLASIDLTDYQLALTMATKQADMARIAFDRAEDEHRRMKMLYDSKSLAPNDYEKYKSAYESARQQYEQAMASEKISRKHLTDAELHSPVNGFISKRSIEPGETASPGRPVFEIVNLDTVEISVGVPETDVHSVGVGQKAAITLPALPGESFEGVVRIVNISADPGTRTFMTRITIPNPKHTLRIGMVAEARIRGDKVVKMLTVPIEAIVRDAQGATMVYVYYPEQKRVYAKRVEIGAPRERDLEIRNGLTGDELIVLAGQTKLRDGSVVSTAEATERPEVNSEGGVRK